MHDIPDIAYAAAGYDFMGVDLSLTGTGVVCRNDTQWIVMTISPPAGEDRGSARLDWYGRAFEALLQYRYKQVAIEGYSFGSKFSRSHALGEQGGLFRVQAYRSYHRLLEIPPKSLSVFLDGQGNIPKKQRKRLVDKHYGLEVDNDNEADAAALAMLAMVSVKRQFSAHYQLDGLENAVYVECAKVTVAPSTVRVRKR